MATESAIEEIATATSEPAGGFVARFGLDPWLFLAQAVNFLIVLAVLTKFVFRPLLKTMGERRRKIEQGVQDAATAAAQREDALAEKNRVLERAHADAAKTLRQTEEHANRLREQIVRTAEEEAAAMHDRAEHETEHLKDDALRAVTAEAGDVVVAAVERVLAEKLTAPDRERYRSAALRALKTPPP